MSVSPVKRPIILYVSRDIIYALASCQTTANAVHARDCISRRIVATAAEVEGVEGMAGGVVEGITGMLNNKKSMTKGVKVEVNEEQVTVEINVIIKYGYKLHEVCANIQSGTKNAIETMTGLTVSAVNVFVSSISFEKAKKQPAQPAAEAELPAEE